MPGPSRRNESLTPEFRSPATRPWGGSPIRPQARSAPPPRVAVRVAAGRAALLAALLGLPLLAAGCAAIDPQAQPPAWRRIAPLERDIPRQQAPADSFRA
jgi:hypothetical protein